MSIEATNIEPEVAKRFTLENPQLIELFAKFIREQIFVSTDEVETAANKGESTLVNEWLLENPEFLNQVKEEVDGVGNDALLNMPEILSLPRDSFESKRARLLSEIIPRI